MDFFTKHGLFAVKSFIGREFCVRICKAIELSNDNGQSWSGNIWGASDGDYLIDEQVKRRSESLDLPGEIHSAIRAKLIDLMPQIAKRFNVELADCQSIKFAIYKEGDYFKQHVDRVPDERAPLDIRERKISVVVFLNDEAEQPTEGTYGGGRLTFYGLLDNSPFAAFGFPLEGEAGTLIAFPPTLPHEVTPVTHGTRYVIVTWYI